MSKIAIIAAAGWKGGGSEHGELVSCPEPLLPIGNTTIISRLAIQLKNLGFEIVIGAGAIGYPFYAYAPFCPKGEISSELLAALNRQGFSLDDSPWTQERIDYLVTLGGVELMPNPGVGNCHDTYCNIMDTLTGWEQLLLVHGDMLFTDVFLRDILTKTPWPSQFSMHPVHTMIKLTSNAAPAYRAFANSYRSGWKTWDEKCHAAMDWPGGIRGVHGLAHMGIPTYSMIHVGRDNVEVEWLDIDEPHKYHEALRRIKEKEM